MNTLIFIIILPTLALLKFKQAKKIKVITSKTLCHVQIQNILPHPETGFVT